MLEQRRWPREGWVSIVAGLVWLWVGGSAGIAGLVLAFPPAVVMLAGGASTLLWPGDPRIHHFLALAALAGVILALPGALLFGLSSAAVLIAASAAVFIAAGYGSIRQAPAVEGVPPAPGGVRHAAEVALDEAMLASIHLGMRFPRGDDAVAIAREVHEARELFADKGWLEKPARYHGDPRALAGPRIERVSQGRLEYEHLSFDSDYEPHLGEPGRERWLEHTPNRTAHAWMLRHPGPERPWLIGIHGFRMGFPSIDLRAFDPKRLHHELGMNLLLPVLPLHGPRKIGRRSGDGFLDGNLMDTLHAEAQALWDLRRLIGWVRACGAPAIGVYGLSLGGYSTALLASFDSDLACAIAGIPLSDISYIVTHHAPELPQRYMAGLGLDNDAMDELFRVVSPLEFAPQVPHARRAIFAGVSDRIVPPVLVQKLYEHWSKPRTVWFPGAHLTFGLYPEVSNLIRDTLREGGMLQVS